MKIYRTIAALALATAFLLPGCDNFTGTPTDQVFLDEHHAANENDIVDILGVTGTLSNTVNQKITINFSLDSAIDVDSITEALTIRNLSDAANLESPYTQGSAIPYTIEQISGAAVTLDIDLTSASADLIELHFDATQLTGRNGTISLDTDGDGVKGETGDDDYYTYLSVTGPATTVSVGTTRNPQEGMALSFGGFSASGGATDRYTITYDRTYESATDTSDYKAKLDGSLIIESYAPATHSWTAVTYTSTYNTGTGEFIASFSGSVEGTVYRARLVNRANLVTNAAFMGYVQRYDMDNARVQYDEIITGPTAAAFTADALQLSEAQQNAAFNVSVISGNGGRGVAVKISLDLSVVGDRGMNLETITPENLRIMRTTSAGFVEMPWTLSYQRTNATYPTVNNVLVLTLDSDYVLAGSFFVLFAGPNLRTLGDEDGTPPARYFGSPTQMIGYGPEYTGFISLNADGATL